MKIIQRLLSSKTSYLRKSSSHVKSPQEYCLDLVRKHDYENYLCTVYLKSKDRPCVFAVRAFNIEVANVVGQVSTVTTGQMRLKFWEETIDKICSDNPPHHPVAQEVHRVVDKSLLSKRNLRQLVMARAEQLSFSTFQTLDNMEKYADSTCSPVYYIVLASLGIEDVHADHAFSHLGKAQGLTNLIRSVPYYAQRRLVNLPQDLLSKHKVSHESVIRGGREKPTRDVVFEVASRAHSHINKAESLVKEVPSHLFRHFLPILPVKGYLERLRLVDFDVFHPHLQLRDHKLAWKLMWRSWRRKL